MKLTFHTLAKRNALLVKLIHGYQAFWPKDLMKKDEHDCWTLYRTCDKSPASSQKPVRKQTPSSAKRGSAPGRLWLGKENGRASLGSWDDAARVYETRSLRSLADTQRPRLPEEEGSSSVPPAYKGFSSEPADRPPCSSHFKTFK